MEKKVKIINGVTIVSETTLLHEGIHSLDGEKPGDLGYCPSETIKMFDANGNTFFKNAPTKESAEFIIKKLEENGVVAIIGPKAPFQNINGQFETSKSETEVGIYIVKKRKENISNTIPNRRK